MDSMGSNPFMSGANPFGGMTPNPFGNLGGTSEAKQNNNFNIDDIVKKIDQKIAELEAEEKREQEEQKKKEQQANVDNSVPVQKTGISPTPQVNSDVTDIYNKTVTDDQFFDDFFDE